MKKFMIVLLFFALTVPIFSQSIWKPVPKNLFDNSAKAVNTAWLWRFSGLVTANELNWVKADKEFVSAPLSSLGPLIGFRHYVPTSPTDETPYNDYGFNAGLLLGADINDIEATKLKLVATVNAFQFINLGLAYTIKPIEGYSPLSILIGAAVNF